MKKLFILFCSLCFSFGFSQGKEYKYYLYFLNSSFANDFSIVNERLIYNGNNNELKSYLMDKKITLFEKTLKLYTEEKIQRVYTVHTEYQNLGVDLTSQFSSIFDFYEDATEYSVELAYYPNDYGNTSPNINLGAPFERKDLDFLNAQKAWDITTGNVALGLSDARINNSDPEFMSKTSFINYSYGNVLYNPNNIFSNHGTNVGGLMAAQGDNAYGSTGVCYNCSIVATSFGSYDNLKLLSNNGVKIINMSWVSHSGFFQLYQDAIDVLVDEGVVLIACAGNRCTYQTNEDFLFKKLDPTGSYYIPEYTGPQIGYPASYNGVISVSGVEFFHPIGDVDGLNSISPFFPVAENTMDSFSVNTDATDINNPIGVKFNGWPRIVQRPNGAYQTISPNGIVGNFTINEHVDILAPGNRYLSFSKFIELGQVEYTFWGGTSASTPYVTGTVGLMRSVNQCLTPYEVENILKLTTKDVENMPINQNFVGQIGAGKLEIGDAVEFTNEMKKVDGNAVIDNHIFNRFEYNLKKINNKLTISNTIFKDNCKANFEARNQIHLLPGTNLKPNTIGNTYLSINPSMDISCTPIVFPRSSNSESTSKNESSLQIVLSPNPNNGNFRLMNINYNDFGNQPIQLEVYDINGRNLYNKILNENDTINCEVNLNNLTTGMYFVKLSSPVKVVDIKFIKN